MAHRGEGLLQIQILEKDFFGEHFSGPKEGLLAGNAPDICFEKVVLAFYSRPACKYGHCMTFAGHPGDILALKFVWISLGFAWIFPALSGTFPGHFRKHPPDILV